MSNDKTKINEGAVFEEARALITSFNIWWSNYFHRHFAPCKSSELMRAGLIDLMTTPVHLLYPGFFGDVVNLLARIPKDHRRGFLSHIMGCFPIIENLATTELLKMNSLNPKDYLSPQTFTARNKEAFLTDIALALSARLAGENADVDMFVVPDAPQEDEAIEQIAETTKNNTGAAAAPVVQEFIDSDDFDESLILEPIRFHDNPYEKPFVPMIVVGDNVSRKILERKFPLRFPEKKDSIAQIEKITGQFFAMLRVAEGRSEPLSLSSDFAGVSVCDRRVNGFALADGVGKSVFGDIAARNAVRVSMQELSLDCAKKRVFNRNRALVIVEAVQKAIQAKVDMNSLIPQIANKCVLDTIKDPFGIGSTTLLFGYIDGNSLNVAHIGDGGLMVVNAAGSVQASIGGHEDDVAPDQLAMGEGRFIKDERVAFYRAQVNKGCKVFAFSDGLLKGMHKTMSDLGEKIRELISQGMRSADIAQILLYEAGETEWEDDGVVVGFDV